MQPFPINFLLSQNSAMPQSESNSLNAVLGSPVRSHNKRILIILLPETEKSFWWLVFSSGKNPLHSLNSRVQGFSGDSPKPTAPSGESANQQHQHTGTKIQTHNQHFIISRIYLQKTLIGHLILTSKSLKNTSQACSISTFTHW